MPHSAPTMWGNKIGPMVRYGGIIRGLALTFGGGPQTYDMQINKRQNTNVRRLFNIAHPACVISHPPTHRSQKFGRKHTYRYKYDGSVRVRLVMGKIGALSTDYHLSYTSRIILIKVLTILSIIFYIARRV